MRSKPDRLLSHHGAMQPSPLSAASCFSKACQAHLEESPGASSRIPIVCENGPLVSVVLPCRNEVHHIERCLESILHQRPPDGGFEIIVADGMSDDGTRSILGEMASQDERLRIIDNRQRIVSTGLNEAIRAAAGKIIIRMDGHTEYATDYIRQCVSVLEGSQADNVGGPLIQKGYSFRSRAIALAFHSRFAVGGALFHNPHYEGPVDTVPFGCWRIELFDQIGVFDPQFVRNQDDEFNLRLTRAGGTIWQSPRIKSTYYPRSTLRSLFCQYMQYGYWKVHVIRKHTFPAKLRHLVPGTFVAVLLVLACAAPFSIIATQMWLALSLLYSALALGVSALTCARGAWRLLPILPFVFFCYHFGYGYGFLRGLWDCGVTRATDDGHFHNVTR